MALLCKSPLQDVRVEKALHCVLIHNKWDRGLSLFTWAAKIGMTPEDWVTFRAEKGQTGKGKGTGNRNQAR